MVSGGGGLVVVVVVTILCIKPKISLNNRYFSLSKSEQSTPIKMLLKEQFEQRVWTIL